MDGTEPKLLSIDQAFIDIGATHPAVTIQLLLALGYMVLGYGLEETSSLLPFPLHGCWGMMTSSSSLGGSCKGKPLVTGSGADTKIWSCGAHPTWLPFIHASGTTLLVSRMVFALCAGTSLDVFGRKISAIVWMGTYFVFSFSRSFAPLEEVYVVCLVMELAAAQAAATAMMLIAAEGSTQKECVRSVSLTLLGHSLGVAVLTPVTNTFIAHEPYRQLARSVSVVVFVMFIFFLPESVRWLISKGKLDRVSTTLRQSHRTVLKDGVKSSITAVLHEARRCLAFCRSRGSSIRESLGPILFCRKIAKVSVPSLLIAFFIGLATSYRFMTDSFPYGSLEDRCLSSGLSEFLAFQFMGLILARLSVKKTLLNLQLLLAIILVADGILKIVGAHSCPVSVFVSCLGSAVAVMTWVWFVVGIARLFPTHSRGSVLGFCLAFATLGHGCADIIAVTVRKSLGWDDIYVTLLFSGMVFASAVLVVLLPPTPAVIPDTILHLSPVFNKEENCKTEEQLLTDEWTRL